MLHWPFKQQEATEFSFSIFHRQPIVYMSAFTVDPALSCCFPFFANTEKDMYIYITKMLLFSIVYAYTGIHDTSYSTVQIRLGSF